MRPARLLAPLVCAAVCFLPAAAHAHLVGVRFGDFYGGMLHVLTALEHALPLLALGLLAGMQEPKVARWILLAAPGGLLLGTVLALAATDYPAVTWFNKASFVLLGLLVAGGFRLRAAALIGIGTLVGVSHGYENGLAIAEGATPHLFAFGVVTLGFVGLALVAAATVALLRGAGWRRIAVRAAGSWIAAIGLMVVVV